MQYALHFHAVSEYQCAYIDEGQPHKNGNLPLILIHNGMMDHRLFEHQIEYFSQFMRVIAVDLLGYGASDKPDITYNTRLYTEQINTLLAHLNIPQCSLLGCCVGGAVAMEFSMQYPEKVDNVIAATLDAPEIIEAGVLGQLSKDTPFGGARHKLGSRLMQTFLGRKLFCQFMKKHQMGSYYAQEPEWDRQFHRYFSEAENIRSFSNLDVEDSLLRAAVKSTQGPISLILWGETNTILPATEGEKWARHFQADIIKRYPGTGYMFLRQRAAQVNLDIYDFLMEIEVEIKKAC
ncbi:MAG: alpha/beta hydrolase [Pseudomonadales bacterium]|nr:alpha/beta hydrolase [Pseudomonadales bacterium]